MTLLHMETDAVHTMATELGQFVSSLYAELPLLQSAAASLELSLMDPQIAALMAELRTVLDACREIAAGGDDLGLRLNKAVASWELVDQDGFAQFSGACATLSTIGQADLVAIAPPAPSATTPMAQRTDVAEAMSEPGEADATGETAVADQSPPSPSAETAVVAETAVSQQPSPLLTDQSWNHRLIELEEINQEITVLEEKIKEQGYASLSEEEAGQLQTLRSERLELYAIIENGIGPSKQSYNGFPEGQCTWYVATRRNVVALNGDAHTWVDSALENDYEVGEIPVKGSVMVWQPGIHGANEQYGHVSHVEEVLANSDGTFTVKYTDNHNPDSPRVVRIRPGEEGVDFIYERTVA
jgi:surface antigen